jgi:hypothetical protein
MQNIFKPMLRIFRYNWLLTREIRKWIKSLGSDERSTIIDIGCGQAPYRSSLKYKTYVGIDYQRDPNLANEVEFLELEKNGIDNAFIKHCHADKTIVLLNQVLKEVPDWQRLLARVSERMTGDAQLLITESYLQFVGNNDSLRLIPSAITRELRKLGFSQISVQYGGLLFSSTSVNLLFSLLLENSHKPHLENTVKISSWKSLGYAPLIVVFNVLGMALDKLLPCPRCPASYAILARR